MTIEGSCKRLAIIKKCASVAGIGNPSKFYNTLTSLGLNLVEHSFPDHYQFKEEDLQFEDNHPILMTEKDAVRCMDMKNKNLWYLSIEAEIKDEIFKTDLLSKSKSNWRLSDYIR